MPFFPAAEPNSRSKLVSRQLLDNALIAAGLLEDARDTISRMNTLMQKTME
jgi:TNF receptor-associated protein 1